MALTARTRSGSALLSIDRECDEFENNWRAGGNPRIEEALTRLPAEARQIAFRELLGIELELRRQRGDEVSKDEYQQRFPDLATTVDEVVASASRQLDATVPIHPSAETVPSSATTSTRYHDLRFFRRGGLGALYRAIDESLHRETVVKFMNDQANRDPIAVAQFKIEAEVTGRLDHPGIVPVYGIGQDWQGRPFYVMRLINGRELKEAIQEYHHGDGSGQRRHNSRQQLFNLLEHLTSACNTVAYAHHVGIVHCDLKPANIMIGKYGETFVLDWGLATNFERSTTFFSPNEPTMRPHSATGGSTSGQRGGTYGYISPEQLWTDGPIGPTSDVYSLGATLYEILTSRPPFNARDPEVREQIRRGQFPSPRSLQPGICPKLEAICLKAMAVVPQARYATAKLLANDLTNWMRDEEIQAAPDHWFNRIARFARRHRGVTAAFFLSLIALIVAAAWTDRTVKMAAHEKVLREKSDQLYALQQKTFQDEKKSFTIALDTFEKLSLPFANGEMSNLGVFRPIVDRIKEFTAAYLVDFETAESMNIHTARVFELRAIVARIYADDTDQAIKDLQRAAELYAKSPATPADKLERDLRLAQNRISQGRLFIQRNELDRALPVLVSAAEGLEQLRKVQPENNLLLRHLAEAYHCSGEVYLNRRTEGAARRQALLDAEDKFNQGKKIREKLVKDTEGEERRNHERDLARSWGYLGDVYRSQGNVAQAGQAYDESKRLRERLYRSKPDDPEHRFQYARGLGNFGELERGYRGNLKNAIEQLTKAEQLQQELTDDFPEVASFSSELAGTQSTLAEIYLFAAQDDPAQADALRNQARKAAQQAAEVYGRLHRQMDPNGAPGLIQCSLMLAILDRETNAAESQRHAREAEDLVIKLGAEPVLAGSELVSLAMARALLGQTDAAFHALSSAVDRGENAAFRLERHQRLAFKAIADDSTLGPQLQLLVKKVRGSLIAE